MFVPPSASSRSSLPVARRSPSPAASQPPKKKKRKVDHHSATDTVDSDEESTPAVSAASSSIPLSRKRSFPTMAASSAWADLGESSAEAELLSPDTQRKQPLWIQTLFPALPSPSYPQTAAEGEGEGGCNFTPTLFPTVDALERYLHLQGVRMQMLQHIREAMSGTQMLDIHLLSSIEQLFTFFCGAQEQCHCASPTLMETLQRNNLRLIVSMLHCLRSMMLIQEEPQLQKGEAAASSSSLSPACTVNIADRLSERNSSEVMLAVLEHFSEDLPASPTPPEDLAVPAPHPKDSSIQQLRMDIVESVLRCLATQLDQVTPESMQRVNCIKQLYFFVPLQLPHTPSLLPLPALAGRQSSSAGAAAVCVSSQGTDSGVIRTLMQFVARKCSRLTPLAVRILNHVATTPIANEHVHSPSTCGFMENGEAAAAAGTASPGLSSPFCTRATPPSPVVTWPPHANSALGLLAASKLFRFPSNPALYLIEKGDLIGEYLDILQPFLRDTNLAAQKAMTSPRHTTPNPQNRSRSLMQQVQIKREAIRQSSGEQKEEGSDDSAPIQPLFPPSPLLRSLRAFHHEPHAHSTQLETRRMPSLTADEFMEASYNEAAANKSDKPGQQATVVQPLPAVLPDFQLPPPLGSSFATVAAWAEQASSPAPSLLTTSLHHRDPPRHQPNELIAAALSGLAGLATRNVAVSSFLVAQPGFLSFLAGCLAHAQMQLSLVAMELTAAMHRSLSAGLMHEAESCNGDEHPAHSPQLVAQLSALARSRPSRHLSRRHSEAQAFSRASALKRRNSRDFSPLLMSAPSSPPIKAFSLSSHTSPSPRLPPISLFGLAAPLHSTPSPGSNFTHAQAHEQLEPLVMRSVLLLVGLIQHQWGPARSHRSMRVNRLDLPTQQKLLSLLSSLVEHSSNGQEECQPILPLLFDLIMDPTTSMLLQLKAIECVTHLGSQMEDVDELLRTKLFDFLLNKMMPKLRLPSEEQEESSLSLSLLPLQLACVRLLSSWAEVWMKQLSERLRAMSDAAASSLLHSLSQLLLQLLSFLDCSHLSLQIATVELVAHLLHKASPLRNGLLKADILPKLVSLTVEQDDWPAPPMRPLPATLDEDCHTVSSLAMQLRVQAMKALVVLIEEKPTCELQKAVLAEMSLDALLEMLQPREEGESQAQSCPLEKEPSSGSSSHLKRLSWALLHHLLSQDLSDILADNQQSETQLSAIEASFSLFSAKDLERVMDLIVTSFLPHTCSREPEATSLQHALSLRRLSKAQLERQAAFAHLLTALSMRWDPACKLLFCAHPQLLHWLQAALAHPTPRIHHYSCAMAVQWASVCVEHLLFPTLGELRKLVLEKKDEIREVSGSLLQPPEEDAGRSGTERGRSNRRSSSSSSSPHLSVLSRFVDALERVPELVASTPFQQVAKRARSLFEHDLFPPLLALAKGDALPPEAASTAAQSTLSESSRGQSEEDDPLTPVFQCWRQSRARARQCVLYIETVLQQAACPPTASHAAQNASVSPSLQQRWQELEEFVAAIKANNIQVQVSPTPATPRADASAAAASSSSSSSSPLRPSTRRQRHRPVPASASLSPHRRRHLRIGRLLRLSANEACEEYEVMELEVASSEEEERDEHKDEGEEEEGAEVELGEILEEMAESNEEEEEQESRGEDRQREAEEEAGEFPSASFLRSLPSPSVADWDYNLSLPTVQAASVHNRHALDALRSESPQPTQQAALRLQQTGRRDRTEEQPSLPSASNSLTELLQQRVQTLQHRLSSMSTAANRTLVTSQLAHTHMPGAGGRSRSRPQLASHRPTEEERQRREEQESERSDWPRHDPPHPAH